MALPSVIEGDFSMVLVVHECFGESYPQLCLDVFWEVLDRINLSDLPLTGGSWTRLNTSDRSSTLID